MYILQAFIQLLPLHAEEGAIRESIDEADLRKNLRPFAKSDGELFASVELVKRLLRSLSLLDERELLTKHWAWVSFPASLLGRSLLETLAQPEARIFERDYWQQGAHRPPGNVEEQRQLLKALETRRQNALADSANPIRVVHVAWGVVRLGNQFVMVHREDKKRPDVKDYVFPGGRLNMNDLPVERQTGDSLRELFSVQSELAGIYLQNTLKREMLEELGLSAEHYQAQLHRTIPPYKTVEGTANNHGLSEYNINLYQIKLTPEGELALLDKVANSAGQLTLFSVADLVQQKTPDGKTAFIDALTTAWNNQREAEFNAWPDSRGCTYRFTEETDAIDVPFQAGQPLLIGKTGKEKPLDLEFDDFETELLQLLVRYSRNLPAEVNSDQARYVGNGWLNCIDSEMLERSTRLAGKLAQTGYPLLDIYSTFVRLNVKPELQFISSEAYQYELIEHENETGEVRVILRCYEGSFSRQDEKVVLVSINRNMKRVLKAIKFGQDPAVIPNIMSGDLKGIMRQQIDQHINIGLRKLVRIESGSYCFSICCL